jgi:nitroreductase
VIDLAAADELLTTTRAVRRRLDLDRPVPRPLVLECITVAQQAPTGGNSQGWGFVVVDDADKRRRIADAYRATADGYLRASRERATDEQTIKVYESAVYLSEILDRVPVHVIPVIHGRVDGQPNGVAAGLYGSIIPAAWSFMLAARARGLGTAWTTLHLFQEKEVGELLGIPDDHTQVALIPLAWFTGDTFKPANRPPAETITHWNAW